MEFSWIFTPCVVALISYSNSAAGEESKVTLTVEGGVSLVGPHCPGTVRLFCEGVDLHFFGWHYNTDQEIIERVEPDNQAPESLPIISANSVFLSVSITLNDKTLPTYRKIANFSSVLTVNLKELSKQSSIRNISCGNTHHAATEQIDVTIINYFMSKIIASYQFGILSKIEVQLMQSTCLENNTIPTYYVKRTGYDMIRKMNCTSSCTTTYTEFKFTSSDHHDLKIVVSNQTHTTLESFEYSIAFSSAKYFSWTMNSTACQQYYLQCSLAQNISTRTNCGVRYITDASTDYLAPQTSLPIKLKPGSMHYYEIFVAVDDHLLIKENVQQAEPPTLDAKAIAIIFFTSVFMLMSLTHFLLLLFGTIFWKTRILASKKKIHISSAVLLFLLVFLCVILLFALGIFTENICNSSWKANQTLVLDIMMVIASLGITTEIVIWTIIICKHRGSLQTTSNSRKKMSVVNTWYTNHSLRVSNSGEQSVGRVEPFHQEDYDTLKFSTEENQYAHLSIQDISQSQKVSDQNEVSTG